MDPSNTLCHMWQEVLWIYTSMMMTHVTYSDPYVMTLLTNRHKSIDICIYFLDCIKMYKNVILFIKLSVNSFRNECIVKWNETNDKRNIPINFVSSSGFWKSLSFSSSSTQNPSGTLSIATPIWRSKASLKDMKQL